MRRDERHQHLIDQAHGEFIGNGSPAINNRCHNTHVLNRRFPDDMARAWVRHNIEEVGQLEYLLPELAGVR